MIWKCISIYSKSGLAMLSSIGIGVAILAICVLGAKCEVDAQAFEIGIVDLFGLSKVSARDVRASLTFKEGDTISFANDERPAVLKSSEDRLVKLPGVEAARINVVCCEQGRAIVYVGIQERGAPTLHLRSAPRGSERLPADIVQAGEEFSKALMLAMQRGEAGEDRSQGHSLMHDTAARAIQERFIVFAQRDLPALRRVLRNSSEAAHRALAAQVLGYVSDKQGVVDDLVRGMSDPADEVRNNSMRALLVFAEAASVSSGSSIHVPARPFIEFLNSPVWTDRNKASGALVAISARLNERVLAELRKSALTPLVEMARWKSPRARAAGVHDSCADSGLLRR